MQSGWHPWELTNKGFIPTIFAIVSLRLQSLHLSSVLKQQHLNTVFQIEQNCSFKEYLWDLWNPIQWNPKNPDGKWTFQEILNIKMYKLWYKIFGDNLCYDSKWYQNELTFLAKNPPKTFQFSIGCKKFKELWNVLGDLQTLWTYEQNTWRLWHLL